MKNKIILLLSFLSCGLSQASDIFKAIALHDKKAIQAWLKNSPDVALTNDQGQTVLMKAVQDGNKWLVKQLLHEKASVNEVDRFGRTALDYAVELHNKDMAKMLLKSNAMVTSEILAVKCKQLLKKISLWKVISGCVFGVGCLYLIFPFAVGAIMASFMNLAVGGGSSFLVISSLAILGVSSAIVYGSVKIATKKEKPYPINVFEPAA